MVRSWILKKLEIIKDCRCILVRDPLRLLGEIDSAIHGFARENGFTVIVAATNLVFRELYDRACADTETTKLLIIDRAPARRRANPSITKAPAPFYPDLLDNTPNECRIDLDLRQFLKEATADDAWPAESDDPRYARLIVRNMEGVLRAHQNLRAAHPTRFEDHDFRTIVAHAALGVAEAAFKKPNAEDYWKIGLLSYGALDELDTLTPEITKPIREELQKAPAPFCYFANHSPDLVVRAFYLSVILAQHSENWNLLLANIDPDLQPLADIKPAILKDAAHRLVNLDSAQAHHDLTGVEKSLTKEMLQFLLLDQLKIETTTGFSTVLEQEGYSTLIRSLALLMALNNLVSTMPAKQAQQKILQVLFPENSLPPARFCDTRPSTTWSNLKDAYRLGNELNHIREHLAVTVKNLKVTKSDQLTFAMFREFWNAKKINRIEYYLSALQRLAQTGNLLPRHEDELPSIFGNSLSALKQRLDVLREEVSHQIEELNLRFQELVAHQYPRWVKESSIEGGKAESKDQASPILTSQFLKRCLKPHWDPSKEKAVLLVFDGMRYDIWDELLRPLFEERMDVVADLPASSLLPSETHITRKAIFAGTFPDSFDTKLGEDTLLKEGLFRELGYTELVEVIAPDTAGTGETVRYRAGNLDVYIFELCDKELHKITMKTLTDGRQVPSRPLSFVYEQHLKNIIDTEVMAIIRSLSPGTKVFVTADHGFGPVAREPIWFAQETLNEPSDCAYLNCRLRVPINDASIPGKVRGNVISFTPNELRMPLQEGGVDKKSGQKWLKEYKAIVFPKTGFSFKRPPPAPFKPDAYTHGGISIQELMIPMVVLKVKSREEGLVLLEDIVGPAEIIEGESIEYRLPISRSSLHPIKGEDIRVDVDATWSREPGERPLPHQVVYIPAPGMEVPIRFRPDPDDATTEERKKGMMERTLTVTISYREGYRMIRKIRAKKFAMRLNSEQVIRRIPPSLGTILGLTPKSMR